MKTIESVITTNTPNEKLAKIKNLLLLGYELRALNWAMNQYIYFDFDRMEVMDNRGNTFNMDELDINEFFEKDCGELFEKTLRNPNMNFFEWANNHWAHFDYISRKQLETQLGRMKIFLVNYKTLEDCFNANYNVIKEFVEKHNEKSDDNIYKRKVYQPNFDLLGDVIDEDITSVWLSKEALEKVLLEYGHVGTETIIEIETCDIVFNPKLVDSNDYIWNDEQGYFFMDNEPLLKLMVKQNAYLIAKDPINVVTKMFNCEKYYIKEKFVGMDGDGNKRFYVQDYEILFEGEIYSLHITNGCEILLTVPDEEHRTILNIKLVDLHVVLEPELTALEYPVIINIPKEIYNEFQNEILCDVTYNSEGNGFGVGAAIIENERYGMYLDDYRIAYAWEVASPEKFETHSMTYEIIGMSSEVAKEILVDRLSYSEDCFCEYLSSLGAKVRKLDPKVEEIIANENHFVFSNELYKFVKISTDKKVVIVCPGFNGEPVYSEAERLELLPNNMEMETINHLNEIFDSNLTINQFNNDAFQVDKKVVIRLKEGPSEEDIRYSYIISSLVTDKQIKLAIDLANYIWIKYVDEKLSLDEIEIQMKEDYQINLDDIVDDDEKITEVWYDLLELVFKYLSIEHEFTEIKTFKI